MRESVAHCSMPAPFIYGTLERVLGELKRSLFPRHTMRDPSLSPIFIAVGYVPVVVAKECVSIGVARHEAHFGFESFDGDKAFLSRSVIDPLVNRRKMQLLRKFQRPNHRLRWQT